MLLNGFRQVGTNSVKFIIIDILAHRCVTGRGQYKLLKIR
jgi:hypothetical protein